MCFVSALDKTGLEALYTAVKYTFPASQSPAGEVLTNSRHFDAVLRAHSSICGAIAAMHSGATPDIVLTEAENALNSIGELTGKTATEDITHRIFDRFCVGK